MFGEIPSVLHPSYAVEALTTAWQAGQVADKLLLGHNPESPFGLAPGLAKRAVWSQPRPLVEIKLVGRVAGATVNDVLVGAVSAAISHYLADRGYDPRTSRRWCPSTCAASASRSPASSATSSPWSCCPCPPRGWRRCSASPRPSAGWTRSSTPRRPCSPSACSPRSAMPTPPWPSSSSTSSRPRPSGSPPTSQARWPAATSPEPASPASSAGCPGPARRPWACASSATTASSGSGSRPMPGAVPDPEKLVHAFDDEMDTLVRLAAAV